MKPDMECVKGFRAQLEKKAGMVDKWLPIGIGATGVATGIAGLYSARKTRKQQKRYMAATSKAVGVLGQEALAARTERGNIAKAVAMNTEADMMSRKVLAGAIKKNYAGDLARAKAILKIHGAGTK